MIGNSIFRTMKLIAEPLPGLKVLEPFMHRDQRGEFVKTFHDEQLSELGAQLEVREEFFSTSQNRVLRGMHFQAPPHAHNKLIYCVSGRCLDVMLDLRKSSATFGQSFGCEVSSANRHVVFIPVGFAHGFLSLEDNTCMIYKTDKVHSPEFDMGIHWDSFGFDWLCAKPVVSERDKLHLGFSEYERAFGESLKNW